MSDFRLSRQEERVLLLARQGLADKQIAVELGLSPDTVRTYWQRIRTKVGGQTRAEIIAMLSDRRTADALAAVHFEKDVLLKEILKRKSIERALRASEQEWRLLADAMPQIVFVSRPDGYIVHMNAQFYTYTGLEPGKGIGGAWKSIVHPDDLPKVEAEMSRCLPNGIPFEIELRIRRLDGEFRWHVNRAIPQKNENNMVIRWIGTATEIHDVIILRDSLARTNDELERAQQIARVGSYEYIPENGTCRLSKNLFSILELPASSGWINADAIFERIDSKDLARIEHAILATLESGKRFDEIYQVKTASGTLLDFHSIANLVVSPEGQKRLVGTSQDITEAMGASRKIDAGRRSLESAEKVAKLGSFDWDVTTSEAYWSPNMSVIFGQAPSEHGMDRERFFQFLHSDDHGKFEAAMAHSLETGDPFEVEYRLIIGGEIRWIHALGSTETVGGKVVRMIGTCQDVTERKNRERELNRNQQLLNHIEKLFHMGSIFFDLDDNQTTWSKNLYAIHRRSPRLGPIKPEEFRNLVHPEDQSAYDESFRRCFQDHKSSQVDIRVQLNGGEWRKVRISASPAKEAGKVRHVMVTVQECDGSEPGPD